MSEDNLSRQVTSAYAADAADYRELWAPVLHPIATALVAELPSARRVLDMGTGVGTLLPHLRHRLGAQLVVGVDLTPEMLSLADPTFARIVGDAARAPFVSATFDVVVLPFVLFHLEQPSDALAEARRMLRPGGAVGTITWESDSGSPALEAWSEELTRHGAPERPPVSRHRARQRVGAEGFLGRLAVRAGHGPRLKTMVSSGARVPIESVRAQKGDAARPRS